MNKPALLRISCIAAILLFCILPAVSGAEAPDYSTTYAISIASDGTGIWKIEYRTPLLTDEDSTAFENYAGTMNTVYLPELRDLMERSAAQATRGTGREMTVNNFSGNARVQTSPSGKYGVVTYTFVWSNFATADGGLSIGDAFVGGMYLAKDDTLVIRYPEGYTVTSAEPAPDRAGDGLIWYGLRSFGPGMPSVILENKAFPLVPVVGALLALVIATAGFILYRRRRSLPAPEEFPEEDETGGVDSPLPEADLDSLEEKIIQMLVTHGGEQFQSVIVRDLGLPKSSVSTTLNDLHQRGIIQKVRKGRENLIRLVEKQ